MAEMFGVADWNTLAELEQNQVGFRDFARAGMSRIKGLDSRSR
jgi:hypothetical protein